MAYESPEENEWEELPLTNPTQVKDPSSLSRILNRIIKWANKDTVAPDPAIQQAEIDANEANIATNTADIATNTSDISTNTSAIASNTTHRTSDGSDHSFIDQDVTTSGTPTFDKVTFGGILGNVVTKTSTYTVTGSDYCILLNMSSNITINLPTASGRAGQVYVFKKIINNASVATLDGNGSQTIDGATTQAISGFRKTFMIISDGSNWQIIGEF